MKKVMLLTTALSFLALSGCTTTGGTITPPTLNLATIQAQAQAIETGINEAAALAEADPQIPAAVVAQIKTSVAALDAVTNTLVGIKTTQSPTQIAAEFTQAAEAVVAVMPIDPATKTAVEVGLALVNAFVAGQTTSPVVPVTTAPVTSKLSLKAEPIIEVPKPTYVPTYKAVAPIVPIPAPTYVP